jgi:hypothetical protein
LPQQILDRLNHFERAHPLQQILRHPWCERSAGCPLRKSAGNSSAFGAGRCGHRPRTCRQIAGRPTKISAWTCPTPSRLSPATAIIPFP